MWTINGRFLTQSVTGVQRYAIETTQELAGLLKAGAVPKENLTVLAPEVASRTLSELNVRRRGFGSGQLWEQLSLPLLYRGILINLCNTFPMLVRRQIVVVHDASIYACPAGYTRAFILFYRLLFWMLRNRSSIRILTNSEFSRTEIARYAGIAASRITVAPCGVDHWNRVVPDQGAVARLGLTGRRYLIAVASANPNKNLDRLVQAYGQLERPDVALVLVGGHNSRVFASRATDRVSGIIRTGYISDEALAALYASAVGFVFPSIYEGFGLPPLEAMTFGCPVISSRAAALPEVCGEAVLYCDAYDPSDMATAMRRLLDDAGLRATLIAAGFKRAEKFKWRYTAQAVLKVAKEIGGPP